MNVLLDECVPARFARSLVGHAVTTVPKHGWSGIKNGDLLALAEKEFDVFVTVDRKLAGRIDWNTFVRWQPNCSNAYLELWQEN